MHRLLLIVGLLAPCLVYAAPVHWFNVRDHGAKGDRLTTDTAAIQAVPGHRGQGLLFNGQSAYADIPRQLLRPTMTVTAWVRLGALTESSVGGRQMLLFAGSPRVNDGFGPEEEVHLAVDAGGFLAFTSRADVRTPLADQSGLHFVAVVYGEVPQLYLDGKLVDANPPLKTPLNLSRLADRLYLGRPTNAALRYFNGLLDDVRIYHEPLTPPKSSSYIARGSKLSPRKQPTLPPQFFS